MMRWRLCQVVQIPTGGHLRHFPSQVVPLRGLPEVWRTLAVLASDGWELVSVAAQNDQLHYFFKYPLSEVADAPLPTSGAIAPESDVP